MGFPLDVKYGILKFLDKTNVRGNSENQNTTLFASVIRGLHFLSFWIYQNSRKPQNMGFRLEVNPVF